MGCGQSHIAVIYPRKAKAKSTGSGGSEESEEECGEGGEEGASGEQMSTSHNGQNAQSSASQSQQSQDDEKLRQMVNITNSPLLQQAELSNSQHDFFTMLDEKINNGPDYKPRCEFELTLEDSRLCRLLEEWQLAKQKAAWGCQSRQQAAVQQPVRKQLQRYHSLQSNGDIRHKQHFYPAQLAQYSQQQFPLPPQQHQYPSVASQQFAPQQYAQAPQYAPQQYPHYPQQYPPVPVAQTGQYPPFLQLSNSVVLFDRSRGGYYTELA